MATTQKQASIARTIIFRSKGLSYTTFLHASTGDLIQQYDSDGNYYPEITPTDPIRLRFTATSSRTSGVVTPDSITYKVGGVTLAFNAAGVCTTTTDDANLYFKKDGTDLLVIGNIAEFLHNVSSLVEAIAVKGSDELYACCPADISEYRGGVGAKVSIAPGDSKAFTLRSQEDSVILKCGVLKKTGWVYNSTEYKYLWEIADPTQTSGWRMIAFGTGNQGTVTIDADDVDTYANIRCTVYKAGIADSAILGTGNPSGGASLKAMPVGSDCVGVQDASDPLAIVCTVKINRTGTGSEVAADIEELDDTMPSTAYLLYEPSLVLRDTSTPVSGTTSWLTGLLTDPAGITTRNVVPASGKYKVFVSDISDAYGEHTLVMTGKLS